MEPVLCLHCGEPVETTDPLPRADFCSWLCIDDRSVIDLVDYADPANHPLN